MVVFVNERAVKTNRWLPFTGNAAPRRRQRGADQQRAGRGDGMVPSAGQVLPGLHANAGRQSNVDRFA